MHILSTLFLLAYAKLQCTIIAALHIIHVHQLSWWSYGVHMEDDANIGYLSTKYILLFVVALLFLIVFLLPFAFVLTSLSS